LVKSNINPKLMVKIISVQNIYISIFKSIYNSFFGYKGERKQCQP
jgi:hypothetical protein